MASFEDELKRFENVIRRLGNLALVNKKIIVRGKENIVKEGPNIIIGNHIGSFKDVALLFRIVPRPIFFNANKQIFTRQEFSFLVKKHLHRHLKRFGLFLNFLLNPFKFLFVDYVSSRIAKVGTIPVDLYAHDKRDAIGRCEEYMHKGRAIVSLQGRGRVKPKDSNPYVALFGRGASIVAHNIYKNEKISVPVTPLAIFGTQVPFLVPRKILLNIGRPMFIKDYWAGEFDETVERFKNALEAAVHRLFLDLIRT